LEIESKAREVKLTSVCFS